MSESTIFKLVGKHYDEAGFQMELNRLPKAAPVEMHITMRYLTRYVPDAARVCEIGVGGGIYSLALAQRGCALHFVDVSRRLLEYVETKIREAGFGPQILGSTYASATNLAAIDSAEFDEEDATLVFVTIMDVIVIGVFARAVLSRVKKST